MKYKFEDAIKYKAYLRMAITGVAGSGKTLSALKVAQAIAPGGRIAVIDTEYGSSRKFAKLVAHQRIDLLNYAVEEYIEAIGDAQAAGFDVLIIDSLSHVWNGDGGILDQVDKIKASQRNGDGFSAWKKATPLYNKLIHAILAAKLHIIGTMRSKMEYTMEKDENTQKNVVRRLGLSPVQRDGFEYEFDIIADMDLSNMMTITKTRCPALQDTQWHRPGAEVGTIIHDWLNDGDGEAPRAFDSPEKSTPVNSRPYSPEQLAEKAQTAFNVALQSWPNGISSESLEKVLTNIEMAGVNRYEAEAFVRQLWNAPDLMKLKEAQAQVLIKMTSAAEAIVKQEVEAYLAFYRAQKPATPKITSFPPPPEDSGEEALSDPATAEEVDAPAGEPPF